MAGLGETKLTRLGFLIFPGFPMACLTSIIEPLRAANEISGTESFAWRLLSEDGGRVRSSAGIAFDPDGAARDAERPDILLVLSDPTARMGGAARDMERHGATIGAVSGGIFPLARAGLLAGHAAAVHWCYEAAFRSEFPDLAASGDTLAIGPRRMTAAGAAAGFDLALHLIDGRLGADVATEVACWFQHPLMRGQGVAQAVPVLRAGTGEFAGDAVREACAIFTSAMEEAPSASEIAARVGLSTRQLERLFHEATGESPMRHFRGLRLKAARQRIVYTSEPIGQIALSVGYATPAPLQRHYKAAYGVTPQEDRVRANRFRVEAGAPLPSA